MRMQSISRLFPTLQTHICHFNCTKHSWDSLPLTYTQSPYFTLDALEDRREAVDGLRGERMVDVYRRGVRQTIVDGLKSVKPAFREELKK